MQAYPGEQDIPEELQFLLESQVLELSDSLSLLHENQGGGSGTQFFYRQGEAGQSVFIDADSGNTAGVTLLGSDERTIEDPQSDYRIEQTDSEISIYNAEGELLGTVQQGDSLEFFPEQNLEDSFRIALDVIGIINGAAGTYENL